MARGQSERCGRLTRGRAIAFGLGCVGASACEDPRVDARVAWVDEVHDDGTRTLHFYDRGEIVEATLQPTPSSRDPEAQVMIVEVAPAGAGALVLTNAASALQASGERWLLGGYLDFEGRRALPLRLPLTGFAPPTPHFTGPGDALAWVEPCADRLALVPLDPAHAQPLHDEDGGRFIAPLGAALGAPVDAALCPLRTGLVSASAAPVIFALAGEGSEDALTAAPGGEIVALRYPSGAGDPDGPDGPDDPSALVELGRATLDPSIPLDRRLGCAGPHGCLGLAAPGGEAVSVLGAADSGCTIQRWAPADEEATTTTCVWQGSGTVLAAISDAHYVVVDGPRVLRVDWRTGEEAALPLLGDGWVWRQSADGSAVTLVSIRGPLLRVTADRLELVNIESTTCPIPHSLVIAPSGRWAAWTCAYTEVVEAEGIGGVVDLSTETITTVIRAGIRGLERYDGVAMWAVAIDDEGELLLYSRADASLNNELWQPNGAPRNLYVLGSDRELSRVSSLEPDPELTRSLRGEFRWLATPD